MTHNNDRPGQFPQSPAQPGANATQPTAPTWGSPSPGGTPWASSQPTSQPSQVPAEPGAICFQLTLPVTRLGIGPFSIDPVEQFLGCSIAHILEPAMTGPTFQRPSAAGPACNVYPLQLPPGEGIFVGLGHFGELGIQNDGGFLRLSVPWMASNWLTQRLGPYIAHGPEATLSADGTAQLAQVWLRLEPGMRSAVPIPRLGELGVEVG